MAEVRVGNATSHADNPICVWIPRPEGATVTLECAQPLAGRYVSVTMTGARATVLSLCQVQVFSANVVPDLGCATPKSESAYFRESCYWFTGKEVGFAEAEQLCAQFGFKVMDASDDLATKFVTARLDAINGRDGGEKVIAWTGSSSSDDLKSKPGAYPTKSYKHWITNICNLNI
jgi:hypothetical protein